MDKETRNDIQRATQAGRTLLERDFREQLEGTYDILLDGTISEQPGSHLSERQKVTREKLVAAVAHKRSTGLKPKEAVDAYLREAAFTTLNRFVALKMLEARKLVQECVSKGEDSSGFREFTALAPGLVAVEGSGYQLYIETLFDEIGQEVKVLFDRRDVASLLWPDRQMLLELLGILNAPELASVWAEDETIGWVYQYFNGDEERAKMRAESQAPRNSRELAVRNQFFTPRYVVQFLTDNTLGRTWYEMMQGDTKLAHLDYLVRRPNNEVFLAKGETAPESDMDDSELSQEELLEQTVHVLFREKKDPRDLRILDPACGSGHFLLYAFELLISIYEEAWSDAGAAAFTETGTSLRDDFGNVDELRRAMPELILRHNLYGVEIDPRAAQIAALALWMRAQRAYNQFEVARAERPPITKTNIVVAEPMPADAKMVEEFAAGLKPPILGDLFKKMVDEMKLAGELGSLLKIEESIAKAVNDAEDAHRQGSLFAGKIESQDFWDTADEKIIAALVSFTQSAVGSAGIKRQLFVDDAAQGVAFIELMRKRFDTVLMNPPFGLVPERAYAYLFENYSGAHNDVFAAFVARGSEISSGGRVGSITSRGFLVAPRMSDFRKTTFLPKVSLLADLGGAVMDEAFVESCAYVVEGQEVDDCFLAFDLRDLDAGKLSPRQWPSPRQVVRSQIKELPSARILYSLPGRVSKLLSNSDRFEPRVGTAREGMKTFDNFRFVRLRWEVESDSIGLNAKWSFLAKGGTFAFYLGSFNLIVNWDNDGHELQEINLQRNGSTAQVRQASAYWRRLGLTFSGRSAKGFSARVLPKGLIISGRGPGIFSESEEQPEYLLGWVNSRLIRALIHLQASASYFATGILKKLPWISMEQQRHSELVGVVQNSLRALLFSASQSERSPYFIGPFVSETLVGGLQASNMTIEDAAVQLSDCMAQWDDAIDATYRVDSAGWGADLLGDDAGRDGTDDENCDNLTISLNEYARRIINYLLGAAFGRWDVNCIARRESILNGYSPFASVPTAGLGAVMVSPDLVLAPTYFADDPGTQNDLVAIIERIGSALFPGEEDFGLILSHAIGIPSLRAFVRGAANRSLFALHVDQYGGDRRKAPIYWQLATPSASYSVWCYYHRLTSDTFFRLGNDYVTPKVDHEERKLNALRQETGPDLTTKQRKAIDAQETFVAELRAFKTEVTRIASLWNPNLNDGVIINFAPLWRLVPQHKPWQKECKKVWDKLVKGDYDWAHLAMHLWSERVVPKCQDDRSLAIAHGLEDEFWIEDDKGKWQKRQVSSDRIGELVAERASTAVKAALKDLLEAPAPVGQTRRRRRARS